MGKRNKEITRATSRRWYQRNKVAEVKRSAPRACARLASIRLSVIELKKSPCSDCKKNFPHYVMDFDHTGEHPKIRNISRMVSCGVALKKIFAEIKKCDLVCSNCHRIRTHERLSK